MLIGSLLNITQHVHKQYHDCIYGLQNWTCKYHVLHVQYLNYDTRTWIQILVSSKLVYHRRLWITSSAESDIIVDQLNYGCVRTNNYLLIALLQFSILKKTHDGYLNVWWFSIVKDISCKSYFWFKTKETKAKIICSSIISNDLKILQR